MRPTAGAPVTALIATILVLAVVAGLSLALPGAHNEAVSARQAAKQAGDPMVTAEISLSNSQSSPVPAGFQMPIAVCDEAPSASIPYPYIANYTLYYFIAIAGQNVYFANYSGAGRPNLYSWFEGWFQYGNAYCYVWWVKLPTEVPAGGSTTIYMYVNVSPWVNYYKEYYPYVGGSPQLLGPRYDNGRYVFVAYGYFNDTYDGWTAGSFSGASTAYYPVPTQYGLEMLNDQNSEGTYIVPPDNWKIPMEPIVIEEAWYESSGADANVIALFGNTSNLTYAGSIGSTAGGSTPAPVNSTFVQYEYCCGVMYLKSASLGKVLTSASFPGSADTFYSWLYIYNLSGTLMAAAGYYEYNSSQSWVPLSMLGTLEYTDYVEAGLPYNPFVYPTLMIDAGDGTSSYTSYQYVEWVVARLYPPNGVYPSVSLEALVIPPLGASVTFTTTTTVTSTTTSTTTMTTTTTLTSTTTQTVTSTTTVTTTSTQTVTSTITSTTTTTVAMTTVTSTVTTTSPVTTTVTSTSTATQTVTSTTTATVTSTSTLYTPTTYTTTATVLSITAITTTVVSPVTLTTTTVTTVPVTTTLTSTVTSMVISTATFNTTTSVTITRVVMPSGAYAAIGAAIAVAVAGIAVATLIGRR